MNCMKYELIIFDLDGTILDTLEDLADATNYSLRKNGQKERSLDEVRAFVGNGIKNLMKSAAEDGSDDVVIDRLFNDFMPYYRQHCADKTKPYAGIQKLLDSLKDRGLRLAVVSNKADSAVQALCEKYFEGIFDISVGERAGILKKPAPDSVNEVLCRLNISREKSIYIGDSEVDIETARNAGMESIIVTWGFREENFLRSRGAVNIANTPDEIEKFL